MHGPADWADLFQLLIGPQAWSRAVMPSSSMVLAILPQYTVVDFATSGGMERDDADQKAKIIRDVTPTIRKNAP
jgi:hypothetical protein